MRRLGVLIAAWLLAACSTPLAVMPTAAVDLGGRWRLTTPERAALLAQLSAVLEAARAAEEQRERRRRPAMPPELAQPVGAGPAAGDHAPTAPGGINNWQQREQQAQQRALLNAVVPGEVVDLAHSGVRIELRQAAMPVRTFTAGARSTLVTSYAQLQVAAGWQGDALVVESRDKSQGLRIVERFRRSGAQLTIDVLLDMPGLDEQRFTAAYQLTP